MTDDGFCDVSIGDYDGDPASKFHEHDVTARREHKCYECGSAIAAGQRYHRVSGQWEGRWDVFRLCLPCTEIGNEFSDGGRVFGSLWEDLEYAWDEGAHISACVNRLSTVASKNRLVEMWRLWKFGSEKETSPGSENASP